YVYSKTGSFYRCSKQACEAFIESYQERFGLDYTILRYGSLYGPRSDSRNAIYSFVDQAIRKRRITYGGNPNALREYIHVEDAAQCSVEILKPEYANQRIILSGHQPMTVSNLFRMISEILGKEIECDFQKDGNNTHYDVTPYSFSPKIGRKLSPLCHVDLGQGILRLIEDLHRKYHPELHNAHGVLVKR
ncbi:MAG: NAD(P)-dependent oxidoreductase, partial [Bacteroidia bacterium]|nr:NAD(P)-dependent oxidoreductase [Bacteroidia bacterium]